MKSRLSQNRKASPIPDRLARAEFLVGVGRLDQARALLERLMLADRHHFGVLELYAKVLWQRCEFDRLLSVLGELILLNPYEPGYQSLKGAVLQSVGKYGEAYAAFNRCCALSSEKPDAAVLAMIDDLERWQGALVSEMLDEDVQFRLEYSRDPVQACRSRGFEVVQPRAAAWVPGNSEDAPMYVRPS